MKTNPTRILLSLALLTGVTMTNAAIYTWTGATSNVWDTGTNWEGDVKPPSGANNDIVFDTNAGLSSGFLVSYSTSSTIGSLTVDIPQLTINSTQTRTLTIGDANKIGEVNITSAMTENSVLFNAGTTPRLNVQLVNELRLTNNGSGQAYFGNARLQNISTGSQTGIVRFQGSGSWGFLANSYLGKNSAGSNQEVNVILQGGTGADAFTGTLRYAASTAMDVAQLQVNKGTFRLESSSMKASEGVHVGEEGTFSGAGDIEGNVLVDGNLVTGFGVNVATLTVNGDLTLSDTAKTSVRVFSSSSADRISGTGILSLDGVLVIDVAPQEIAGIVLYDGFSAVNGYFSGVFIGDTALSQISAGEWGGVVDGYEWSFLSETGVLSSTTAVPEPAVTGALLAAGVLCAVGLRRARRKRSDVKA